MFDFFVISSTFWAKMYSSAVIPIFQCVWSLTISTLYTLLSGILLELVTRNKCTMNVSQIHWIFCMCQWSYIILRMDRSVLQNRKMPHIERFVYMTCVVHFKMNCSSMEGVAPRRTHPSSCRNDTWEGLWRCSFTLSNATKFKSTTWRLLLGNVTMLYQLQSLFYSAE